MLELALKQHPLAIEKQAHHLDTQIKQSRELLLRLPEIPGTIKRDLRELFNHSETNTLSTTGQAIQLLTLYERAVKILTHAPHSADQNPLSTTELALSQLNEELQNLITELDFEGEAGDLLHEVRAKLLVGVNTQTLLELTLQVLKLVIDGTQYERKHSEQFLEQVNSALVHNLKTSAENLDKHTHFQTHRQEIYQELQQLVTHGQKELNKLDQAPITHALETILTDIAALSEHLNQAQQQDQALIERMHYANGQIKTLFELTQDHRRRIEDQAHRLLQDPLTKVYNRTAFNDRLELEYRRWIRSQHPLRIAIFDIDKFKTINENFGYLAGDKALKIIAKTISKELNQTDIVARFSGEEFILLLPERSDNECHTIIQKIQRNVGSLPFKFRDKSITITLSGASTVFKEFDTPEVVLDRLYHSLQELRTYGPNQLAWK